MLLPLSWLREFVPYEGTAQALGDRLTMLGLEMDGFERPYAGLAPIVVGHVVECGKHPEADKLSVTRVDVGDEILDIVCGAPNVAQGQKVAVVKVGSTLPNGLTIKKAKLRGMPSHGMICSESELGISDDHDGIMVLDNDAPVGKSILEVLPFEQEVLDIGLTPNRGDCLSILGLAREVAATYNLPLTLPSSTFEETAASVDEAISITIQDGDRAPLYFGRVIEGVTTKKSAMQMRFRLHALGIRAISNIVDVTNYVMMELGQPLHAFDLGAVRDRKLIIRPSVVGEKVTTLDGQDRVLDAGDIVIADQEKILGLGGIMGGANSEITADSSHVFLECATFAPWQIRRTKRRLGINSEAAFRFERGVDQTLASYALERATSLLTLHAGGRVYKGIAGVETKPWKAPCISLSRERSERLLGVELTDAFCEKTLQALGCKLERTASLDEQGQWNVTPPCRPDLTREVDLIEELARVYGVDKIPAILPAISRPLERAGLPEPLHAFLRRIKHWCASTGLNETVNYSFTSSKVLDMLGVSQEERVALENPLSEDLAILRPEIAPGILSAMKHSLAHGASSVRLFEVAAVFHKESKSETSVIEPQRLGILLTGAIHDRIWPNTKGDLEYVDCKGLIESLLVHLGLKPATFSLCEGNPQYLLPLVRVEHEGQSIGYLGKVKPEVADYFEARKDIWLAELDLNALHSKSLGTNRKFVPLTVFPQVRRDITLRVAFGITADSIQKAIRGLAIPILEDVILIDSFEPEGKQEKNVTFRLTFRHKDRTLKESEADKQRDVIVAQVTKTLCIPE